VAQFLASRFLSQARTTSWIQSERVQTSGAFDMDSHPIHMAKKIEGRLHLCSRSLVLEPNESSRGTFCFPFKRMDAPEYPSELIQFRGNVRRIPPRDIRSCYNNVVVHLSHSSNRCHFTFCFIPRRPLCGALSQDLSTLHFRKNGPRTRQSNWMLCQTHVRSTLRSGSFSGCSRTNPHPTCVAPPSRPKQTCAGGDRVNVSIFNRVSVL
jgi:hypothetical protein